MKRSELAARSALRPLAVRLDGETTLDTLYRPRWLTASTVEAFDELNTGEDKTGEQRQADLCRFLPALYESIGIQDEDGTLMMVSEDALLGLVRDSILDLNDLNILVNSVFADTRERSNPTPPPEPGSSTGSVLEESLTPAS
ncbi:MAG TPA: hypothetical protein VNM48_03615 [Chloroflexota bacterium]|nr:hypothetical protein [Chloroflexota bacterium]